MWEFSLQDEVKAVAGFSVVAKKLRKSYSENDLRTIDKNNATKRTTARRLRVWLPVGVSSS